MSSNAFKSCAELTPAGYTCDHELHGKIIRSLCPATCKCAAPACCDQKGAVPSGILVEKTDSWAEHGTEVTELEDTKAAAKTQQDDSWQELVH